MTSDPESNTAASAASEHREPRLTRLHITLACLGVLLGFAVPLPFVWTHGNAPSEYGALLQGVASAIALGLLLITLHLQRHDLHLQRRELELTRKEMRENTEEQKGQRAAMNAQLAELRRQSELLKEQHDLRLKPILETRCSPSEHFNLDLPNGGFERGYVWRVQIRKVGSPLHATEDIAGCLNGLIDRFGLRSLVSGPVSAAITTPRVLKVGEAYPVFDFSLDFARARRENLVRALREFYEVLAEYEIVAETTDIRNLQPQAFQCDLRRLVARIQLPEG